MNQLKKRIVFWLRLRGSNRVKYEILDNGKVVSKGTRYNARVNTGAALQASLMSGSTLGGISSPAAPLYIGLSTASLTPAKTDTTLTSETSATGLARALGTAQNYVAPTVVDGAASFDVYKSFTNSSGGTVTLNSTALFDAASTGNLFAEVNFSGAQALNNLNVINVTWTVNI